MEKLTGETKNGGLGRNRGKDTSPGFLLLLSVLTAMPHRWRGPSITCGQDSPRSSRMSLGLGVPAGGPGKTLD